MRDWQHLAQPTDWRTTPCPLSATAYLLYSQLPYYLRPFLRPHPEDAQCRGDRDTLVTVQGTFIFHFYARKSGYNTYRGWTQIDYQNKHYNINQRDKGTLNDRGRDGGTNFILRIKEQETLLNLHDDDDDDLTQKPAACVLYIELIKNGRNIFESELSCEMLLQNIASNCH